MALKQLAPSLIKDQWRYSPIVTIRSGGNTNDGRVEVQLAHLGILSPVDVGYLWGIFLRSYDFLEVRAPARDS